MFLQKMFEQFENIGAAEKLGPISSMMLISIWRKAEKIKKINFTISPNELMVFSGIKKTNDLFHCLNRLVNFGFIKLHDDKEFNFIIECNVNLYEPFEKEKDENNTSNMIDSLESCYIRLRGSGTFLSPADYEEMRKIFESGLSIENAILYLEECFEQFIPKYKGDSIRSFKYCSSYILSKLYQEQAKKGEFKYNGEYQPNHDRTSGKKPETPRTIKDFKNKLRERGLLQGIVGDIECDF